MSKIEIHGISISTYTRNALLTAAALHLPVELVNTSIFTGDNKTPEFLATQPFGQIPVLVDSDGTTLYESRAIARYLATKYGKNNPDLFPITNIKQYGLLEQWISIESSNFKPHMGKLIVECWFKPTFMKVAPNAEVVAEAREMLGPVLDVYEAQLSKTKFLCGDKMTLADIFHIPFTFYICKKTDNVDLFQARPHVNAWLNGMFELPEFVNILKD